MKPRKLGTALTGLTIIALLAMLPFMACAETPTIKPYVPEFQVEVLADDSIKIWITNQPSDFTINGVTYYTFLEFQFKNPSDDGTEWWGGNLVQTLPRAPTTYEEYIKNDPSYQQSTGKNTLFWSHTKRDSEEQLDFRIRALRGHAGQAYCPPDVYTLSDPYYYDAIVYDTCSDWSDIQTVTIPPDPTPTPTAKAGFVWTWENTATALSSLAVLLLFVIAVLLFYIKKNIRAVKHD